MSFVTFLGKLTNLLACINSLTLLLEVNPGLSHGEGSLLEVRIDVVDDLLEGAVREASARRHLPIGSCISVASELSFPELI